MFHHQRAHHHVLVEEPPWRLAIRGDPADNGRQVNHDLRAALRVHLPHVRLARQVVLRLARREHLTAATALERLHDMPPEETSPSRDDDAFGDQLHMKVRSVG